MKNVANKIFGAVAAGAMALTPTATFAEDAVAPANMNVATASISPLQVQFVDAQNRTANDARILAAAASTDQVAIVVWGGNRMIQQEAYNAARDLAGVGIPTAFVLAPDGNGIDTDAFLQIYAASAPRADGTLAENGAERIRQVTRDGALAAYREAFPAQLAALTL